MKICKQCGVAKPATSEYFHKHSKPGRLNDFCCICANEVSKKRWHDNKVFIRGQVSFDNEHYLLCMRLLPPGSMAGEVL